MDKRELKAKGFSDEEVGYIQEGLESLGLPQKKEGKEVVVPKYPQEFRYYSERMSDEQLEKFTRDDREGWGAIAWSLIAAFVLAFAVFFITLVW